MKANEDIRERMRSKEIPAWKIAKKMNVHENTIVRWLRVPLESEKKKQIEKIIYEIAANKQ